MEMRSDQALSYLPFDKPLKVRDAAFSTLTVWPKKCGPLI